MNIMHNDDAFVTMLLLSRITPGREELVRPLTIGEYYALSHRMRESGMGGIGSILNLDLSGFMLNLDMTETEAYRLCVLLSRVLPMTMSLERFGINGIDIVTCCDRAYPKRFTERLGIKAPPMFYMSGTPAIFRSGAIAILGAQNARGHAQQVVSDLTTLAVRSGYTIITDGTNGIGYIAQEEADARGGRILELAAEALLSRVAQPGILSMIELGSGSVMSLEHPEAPYTASHALRRNKCLYALSRAVFIIGAEHKKGATWDGACEAMGKKYCDFIYVWDSELYTGNRALIERGATPFSQVSPDSFEKMINAWNRFAAKQLSFFDA